MSFVAFVEIINFILASLAAVLSFGILRMATNSMAASWRYSLVAFGCLSLATFFSAVAELGGVSMGIIDLRLLGFVAHLVFVLVAFLGLWRYYGIIKNLCGRDA